jgi:hypothetical protein
MHSIQLDLVDIIALYRFTTTSTRMEAQIWRAAKPLASIHAEKAAQGYL